MMTLQTGQLPKEADTLRWGGWHSEIVDRDGETIDKVLTVRKPDRIGTTGE